MNRDTFFQSELVQGFLDYISEHLETWAVHYRPHHFPEFQATGVTDAVAHYYWPGNFIAPANLMINNHIYDSGGEVHIQDWHETKDALQALSTGLRDAISQNDNNAVLSWSKAILRWGMGNRGQSTLERIANWVNRANHLSHISTVIENVLTGEHELERISNAVVPWMSSGLAKILSLSNPNGLIILDSRVALALGTAINSFLQTVQQNQIPPELRVGYSADRNGAAPIRMPAIAVGQCGILFKRNHPSN
jgi:hypothetical protein